MLWTLFKFLIAVWTLRTLFLFGGSAVPVVLVVWLTALVLRLIIRRMGRLRDFDNTGKFSFIRKLGHSPAPSESHSIFVHQ